MDYSLLVGIHNLDQARKEDEVSIQKKDEVTCKMLLKFLYCLMRVLYQSTVVVGNFCKVKSSQHLPLV